MIWVESVVPIKTMRVNAVEFYIFRTSVPVPKLKSHLSNTLTSPLFGLVCSLLADML